MSRSREVERITAEYLADEFASIEEFEDRVWAAMHAPPGLEPVEPDIWWLARGLPPPLPTDDLETVSGRTLFQIRELEMQSREMRWEAHTHRRRRRVVLTVMVVQMLVSVVVIILTHAGL
jgi:hypothetical protein